MAHRTVPVFMLGFSLREFLVQPGQGCYARQKHPAENEPGCLQNTLHKAITSL